MVTPAELHVRLLGELDLRLGETALPPLESARAESLLAYLLLHRDAPQPRQRLAFLLWPDSTEPQARTNLRQVLHNLRRALPDAERFLEVTARTLRWRPDAPLRLDVAAFEDALARARDDDLDALREAVDAYTGDLLEGCYDEWLLEERERLRQRHLEALERLAELLEEQGDAARAIVLRRAARAPRPAARGDLPAAHAPARRARRPGAGAARLPRLRGDARSASSASSRRRRRGTPTRRCSPGPAVDGTAARAPAAGARRPQRRARRA